MRPPPCAAGPATDDGRGDGLMRNLRGMAKKRIMALPLAAMAALPGATALAEGYHVADGSEGHFAALPEDMLSTREAPAEWGAQRATVSMPISRLPRGEIGRALHAAPAGVAQRGQLGAELVPDQADRRGIGLMGVDDGIDIRALPEDVEDPCPYRDEAQHRDD